MINRLSIIDALEATRKAQGLRQEDLADLAGTSRVTVGRVEAGQDPRLTTVYELARALGLELMLVPKSLAGEVQAFIQSGGRVLGQPSGAGAPDSVVAISKALSEQALLGMGAPELKLNKASAATAKSLARQFTESARAGLAHVPETYWANTAGVRTRLPAALRSSPYRDLATSGLPPSPKTPPANTPPPNTPPSVNPPSISAAALTKLRGLQPPKSEKR